MILAAERTGRRGGLLAQPQRRPAGVLVAQAEDDPTKPKSMFDAVSQSLAYGSRNPATAPFDIDPAGLLSGMGRAPGIRAYHGSPHDFDRFSTERIGTGEGAQVYGRGLYFAEKEEVARQYRDSLSDTKDFAVGELRIPSWIAKRVTGYDFIQNPDTARIDQRGIDDVRADFLQRLAEAERQVAAGDWNANIRVASAENVLKALNAIEAGTPVTLPGRMYEVEIAARPEEFLDWDKPLSEQSGPVQGALRDLGIDTSPRRQWTVRQTASGRWTVYDQWNQAAGTFVSEEKARAKAAENSRRADSMGGMAAYSRLGGNPVYSRSDTGAASARLRDAGIPGIRYLDQGSRGQGEGTRNYVVFDDKLITILRKYGFPITAAGASIAAGMGLLDDSGTAEAAPPRYRTGRTF